MSISGFLTPLRRTLLLVFFSMVLLMTAYEVLKQIVSPDITIWQSHIVTIVFTSVIAVVIVAVPLRNAIDERRKTEHALEQKTRSDEDLRRSEVRYRTFIESAEDAIYTVDEQLRYLAVNTRQLQQRGLSPEAYHGKSYADFHTPEETDRFSGLVDRVIRTGETVQDEYARGGRSYLRKITPVVDPVDRRIVAVTVVSRDTTDQKEAVRMVSELNRKLDILNQVTWHDIINKLTVISGFNGIISESTPDPNIREYLGMSDRAVVTIRDQIQFARDYREIGIHSPCWQEISSTVEKAGESIPEFPVFVGPECSGKEVYADPLLVKAFYNLIDNSRRYGDPGDGIRISCVQEGKDLTIAFEDNGEGVPAGEKERIFERGVGKNTGFGLFLIREILRMTGIEIHETGEQGKGARFVIRVPEGKFRDGPVR